MVEATGIESLAGKMDMAARNGQAAEHQKLAEELRLRANIFTERQKALANDPAGAVAAEAEKSLPEDADAAARTDLRLAAQANNGVPSSLRKVLTNEEAGKLNTAWREGDLTARLAIAASLQAYGPHAGNAASEIGISPSEQIVLLQAKDPAAAANLATVIAAAGAKTNDLPKVEKADTLAREAAADSEVVRGFRAAAVAMPGNAALQSMVRNYEDTLGKLVRMNGGDTEAAKKVLDGSFRAMTDGNHALVFNPKDIDPGKLETALSDALTGKRLEAMADNRTFESVHAKKAWLADMRRTAIWMNAPDADGFVLFDPVAQAPVMDKSGNVLRVRDVDVKTAPVKAGRGVADMYSRVPGL